MNHFATIIAGLALIISAGQAYLSYEARDNHVEAAVARDMLVTCGELGFTFAEFVSAAEKANSRAMDPAAFEVVKEAAEDVKRAFYQGSYLLPGDFQPDLNSIRDVATQLPGTLFSGDEDGTREQLGAFNELAVSIQDRCRTSFKS